MKAKANLYKPAFNKSAHDFRVCGEGLQYPINVRVVHVDDALDERGQSIVCKLRRDLSSPDTPLQLFNGIQHEQLPVHRTHRSIAATCQARF